MTIYKQVVSQSTLGSSNGKESNVDDLDESFEYFSDKEEAEKHRRNERNEKTTPKIL